MIQLPLEKKWTGDGWGSEPRLLVQVERSEKNAIYRVTAFRTGVTTGYEVFKIRITPKGTQIFDKITEDDEEKYPTAEQFGKTAWITVTLERAKEIFNRLEQGLDINKDSEPVDPAGENTDLTLQVVNSGETKRRGRPKVERPEFIIPGGEFSVKELAEYNKVEYPVAFLFIKEQEGSGKVKRTRTERRAARGPETQLFSKI